MGEAIRERYGRRRDPDAAADALADYWADQAARRAASGDLERVAVQPK